MLRCPNCGQTSRAHHQTEGAVTNLKFKKLAVLEDSDLPVDLDHLIKVGYHLTCPYCRATDDIARWREARLLPAEAWDIEETLDEITPPTPQAGPSEVPIVYDDATDLYGGDDDGSND